MFKDTWVFCRCGKGSIICIHSGFWKQITWREIININSTCVSKWKLGRHKHKHKKNVQVRSSCACTYVYLVALTRENWVDISTSISTRPWTNHRSLWPRPHANISKAMWRTLRPQSCLSLGWGELVSRIESNMLFCAWACLSENQAWKSVCVYAHIESSFVEHSFSCYYIFPVCCPLYDVYSKYRLSSSSFGYFHSFCL